jgi:hypothetical protein
MRKNLINQFNLKVWDRVAFGNWRPYEEAKKYAQSLKLKGQKEWFYILNLKIFQKIFPKVLIGVYKNEWKGMG